MAATLRSIRRPIAMLAAFDNLETLIAHYVFDVIKSEISRIPPEDAKGILVAVFDKKFSSAPQLMVAVIKQSDNAERKTLAGDLLLKWDHSKGVKFLMNEHRSALMCKDPLHRISRCWERGCDCAGLGGLCVADANGPKGGAPRLGSWTASLAQCR